MYRRNYITHEIKYYQNSKIRFENSKNLLNACEYIKCSIKYYVYLYIKVCYPFINEYLNLFSTYDSQYGISCFNNKYISSIIIVFGFT